jgi:hypothetical protein
VRGVRSRVLARLVKAREVGRTVGFIARIAAATNVFVVGDASSRDGWWSVGGEVDWQGHRRRVGGQRAASSARLSVGLGSVQVDVFVGCHCCGFFGSLKRCGLYAQPDYLPTGTIVPTIHHSTLPSSAIHFPQKNAPEGMEANVEEGSRASHGNFSCLERANAVADGTNRIGSRDSDQWRSDCM